MAPIICKFGAVMCLIQLTIFFCELKLVPWLYSCSSGDSSWSNRSGSSILGGSPRNERSRMEPLKPTFRSPMKLQERPHESHINSAFDRSLCTPQKVHNLVVSFLLRIVEICS